jgi:hypothetical protein
MDILATLEIVHKLVFVFEIIVLLDPFFLMEAPAVAPP